MQNQAPAQDELQIVISRIKAGIFMTVVGGMLFLTLASTFGDEAMRTILLSVLTIVFVIGGGMLGLVSMHHVSHTHLPEEETADELVRSLAEEEALLAQRKRPRGFLGLFALGHNPNPRIPNKTDNPGGYRRTA